MVEREGSGTKEERKRKLQDATREHILEAAAQAITETGLDRLTMDEVARQSGFAVGTLYNYFASKDELALALLRRHMGQLTRILDVELPDSLSAEAALAWYVGEILKHIASGRPIVTDLAGRIHDLGCRAVGLDFAKMREEAGAGERRLTELIAARLKGSRCAVSCEDLGWALSGMIRGYAFRHVVLGQDRDRPPEEVAALMVRVLLHGALRGKEAKHAR